MNSTEIKDYILDTAEKARKSALKLARISTDQKNSALKKMIELIEANKNEIKSQNRLDLENAEKNGLSKAMIDRLELNDKRIASITDALRDLIKLEDPVKTILKKWQRPNGMVINKVRVPIGVIGIIFESRPNVTVDAASLCLKTGNATILRGGKEAIHSNMILATILQKALAETGLPKNSIQVISTTDRTAVGEMLKCNKYIDLIIPRGGEELIRRVVADSTIPVIKHYKGVCHFYADKELDQDIASKLIVNAKVQRPGVCNALETLLIHKDIAKTFLPIVCNDLIKNGVEIHGDKTTQKFCDQAIPATEEDWYAEYLDLILAVKVVNGIDEAMEHIEKYGSRHSDGIITTNENTARDFLEAVDSAIVFHNVSIRFSDGGQFGMGAEIGVSTDKLHARGPMGLEELTSYKYIVTGNGQIRE